MTIEQTQDFQQEKLKYKDIGEALDDSTISPEEQAELQEKYSEDCEEIHAETAELCMELKNDIEDYKELKAMSVQELRKIQVLSGVPKAKIDGAFGPTTFAYFQNAQESIAANVSPKELVEMYDTYFETARGLFDALSFDQRIHLQQSIGTGADGGFGPGTFQKICEARVSGVSDVEAFFDPEALEAALAEIQRQKEIAERNDRLLREGKEYPKGLVRQLQKAVGAGADGIFGKGSLSKILEKYPDITSLEEAFTAENINTDIDKELSRDGSPEVFRDQYGAVLNKLSEDLGGALSPSFFEAIIRKETTYGANLNSGSGSKGLMQLTYSAFQDMRGDEGIPYINAKGENKIRVSERTATWKTQQYQEIFQRIDLDAILNMIIEGDRKARDRMPSNIIEDLKTIQTSENITDVQASIDNILSHIKSTPDSYDHITNMICGTVYLTYIHENRTKGNEWKTAEAYNGDNKLLNGVVTKVDYANKVMSFKKEIDAENS